MIRRFQTLVGISSGICIMGPSTSEPCLEALHYSSVIAGYVELLRYCGGFATVLTLYEPWISSLMYFLKHVEFRAKIMNVWIGLVCPLYGWAVRCVDGRYLVKEKG